MKGLETYLLPTMFTKNTFRDLLNKCDYKVVFNDLYKKFLQDKKYSNSKITEYDVQYSRVFKELSSLPSNPKDDLKIYLASVGPEKIDIDTCLLDEPKDELFALDFVEWKDIIDIEIYNSAKLTQTECLAHILWEITFWGFSEKEIQKQSKKIQDESNEK